MTEYKIIGKKELIKGTISLVISYRCPKCGMKLETVWLYPEALLLFTTNCCDRTVIFV